MDKIIREYGFAIVIILVICVAFILGIYLFFMKEPAFNGTFVRGDLAWMFI